MRFALDLAGFTRFSHRLVHLSSMALFLCLAQTAYAAPPAIVSATVPADATYTVGQNLDFSVTWDQAVVVNTSGGTPYITVMLDTGGSVQASYVSGSGIDTLVFRYTVVSGQGDTNGITIANSITLAGGMIRDTMDISDVDTTGISFASTTGVLVDAVAPTTVSINRQSPSGAVTALTSVVYRVTFSEHVSGVDVSDFNLATTSGTAAGHIASVSAASGTTIDVTVDSITGQGSLRLDLNGSGTGIADDVSLPIGFGHSGDQTYTIDTTAPTIGISAPSAAITAGADVTYTVTYADTNFNSSTLATSNITLNHTGTATAAMLVTGSGATRTVTLTGLIGDGTLGISIASGTATDMAGNSAPAAGPSTTFVVDNTAPTISIGSPSVSVTSGGPVTYTVTYADTNFNSSTLSVGDITVTHTGTAAATVAVTGSGTTRTIILSSITGSGTLRIGSIAAGTATDTAGNSAPAAGASTAFTVDNTAPSANPITRSSFNPSTSASVDFAVNFSENVTGVDTSDFTLVTTGTAGGTIAAVTPFSASSYTVTVNHIVGTGTLGLNLNASGTGITDGAGNPISGSGVTGQVYTVSAAIDVGVGISSGDAGINGGNTNTYTITVGNNGPASANSVGIAFVPPAELTGVTWSCVASAGASCPTPTSGTGTISKTATLPGGESLTYVVIGTVADETAGSISCTATVTPLSTEHDLSHADDTATQTDPIGIYRNGFE